MSVTPSGVTIPGVGYLTYAINEKDDGRITPTTGSDLAQFGSTTTQPDWLQEYLPPRPQYKSGRYSFELILQLDAPLPDNAFQTLTLYSPSLLKTLEVEPEEFTEELDLDEFMPGSPLVLALCESLRIKRNADMVALHWSSLNSDGSQQHILIEVTNCDPIDDPNQFLQDLAQEITDYLSNTGAP